MNPNIKGAAQSPAFARQETDDNLGSEGISTRTYIATKMLSGMVSNPNSFAAVDDKEDFAVTMCRHAVELADKLIAELCKQ